ncbi:MAG: preprotein translocase subunit SecE [Bacteroidaceae bacterium]|nr:preprotein translocase subunit SecE [Bacteroidaceae bacterium]
MFKSIATYCKESYNELVHKVTWPSSKELASTAVLVLSASIIIALIVFAINKIFELIVDLIY